MQASSSGCERKPNHFGKDHVHFGPEGDRLVGCLITRALLAALRNDDPAVPGASLTAAGRGGAPPLATTAVALALAPAPPRPVPRAGEPGHGGSPRAWCYAQGGRDRPLQPSSSDGWEIVNPRTGALDRPSAPRPQPVVLAGAQAHSASTVGYPDRGLGGAGVNRAGAGGADATREIGDAPAGCGGAHAALSGRAVQDTVWRALAPGAEMVINLPGA